MLKEKGATMAVSMQYVRPRNATTMSMRAISVCPFELVCVNHGKDCSMRAFAPVCGDEVS